MPKTEQKCECKVHSMHWVCDKCLKVMNKISDLDMALLCYIPVSAEQMEAYDNGEEIIIKRKR